MNVLLIGNKIYKHFQFNEILDNFKNNYRFNFALSNKNNGTICDKIVLNNHVYSTARYGIQAMIQYYKKHLPGVDSNHIIEFYNELKKYKSIESQSNEWKNLNLFLEKIGCPLKFKRLPRVGYIKMIELLMMNIKVFIYGFSVCILPKDDNHLYNDEYVKKCLEDSGHDHNSEIEILIWLHNNGYVDASLCLIEDEKDLTFYKSSIKPTETILNLLKRNKESHMKTLSE